MGLLQGIRTAIVLALLGGWGCMPAWAGDLADNFDLAPDLDLVGLRDRLPVANNRAYVLQQGAANHATLSQTGHGSLGLIVQVAHLLRGITLDHFPGVRDSLSRG